ncbi:MAG: hypothetical protein U5K69_26550 [Balneolaceae bacterium]|nr:hypothetical protein [Balneolaceae bacterium]
MVETDSTFGESVQIGRVRLSAMDEISGIAASRQNANLLWAHNDSGDKPRIFLIRQTGELVAIFELPGIKHIDWEDMAIGPGPDSTQSYLYIADIGNNRRNRHVLSIYRIPEPHVVANDKPINSTLKDAETIEFRYPEGTHNAETLFMDSSTRDLYIVTKNEEPEQLYRLPYPQSTERVNRAVPAGSLPISGALGGELSADGRLLLIKTQQQVLIWHLENSELPEAITQKRPRQPP